MSSEALTSSEPYEWLLWLSQQNGPYVQYIMDVTVVTKNFLIIFKVCSIRKKMYDYFCKSGKESMVWKHIGPRGESTILLY